MPKRKELSDLEKKQKKIAFGLCSTFLILIFFSLTIFAVIYTLSDWLALFVFSIIIIIPAYISNAGMVIVGGGKPIDGGKVLKDGNRLFGDHKTWNGFIKGPLYIGIPLSLVAFFILYLFWPDLETYILGQKSAGVYILYADISVYKYYIVGGYELPLSIVVLVVRVVLSSYGAAIGDLIGSCLKRRFNIGSGKPFWVIDQLDFAIFALILISIPALLFPTVFLLPDLFIVIFLMILTPSVSVIANTVAYFIGIKEVPW